MLTKEDKERIERRALEIAATIETKQGKFVAEHVPNCTPQWHLVETAPSNETKAAEFLMKRRFGVFLPMFEPDVQLKYGNRLIFPGHVFVFVWDVLLHWRRIKACPGVVRIMLDRPEHPVVLNDETMDFIQALQFGFSPRIGTANGRKSRKAKHQLQEMTEDTFEKVLITTPSHWRDVEKLDGKTRNHLLHTALGLTKQAHG
jgi:transcription antitermination factor NusG